MTSNAFPNLKPDLNCADDLIYKIKINSNYFYITKKKTKEEGFIQV